MNPTIETILNRRSIRKYSDKLIDEADLNEILQCGNSAPSGAANRNWRFVIVQSNEFRKKLAALARPRYEKWLSTMPESFQAMRAQRDKVTPDPVYYDAPLIVFIIGWGKTCELDTPMVCQNMMLAAASKQIGSCWVYIGQLVLDDPEVRSALKLKEGEKVFGPIVFGYPSEPFPAAPDLKLPEVIRL